MASETGMNEATEPGVATSNETQSGLDENIAGLLCYALMPLSSIFFYATEKENEFVKFHAMQGIVVGIALIVGSWILNTLLWSMFWSVGAWGFISLLTTLVWLGVVVVWAFLMYKAYNGEHYKFPVLGDIAENQVK